MHVTRRGRASECLNVANKTVAHSLRADLMSVITVLEESFSPEPRLRLLRSLELSLVTSLVRTQKCYWQCDFENMGAF